MDEIPTALEGRALSLLSERERLGGLRLVHVAADTLPSK
jgi:hypothetical protein